MVRKAISCGKQSEPEILVQPLKREINCVSLCVSLLTLEYKVMVRIVVHSGYC